MAGWNMTMIPWHELIIEPMRLLKVNPFVHVIVGSDKKDTTKNIIKVRKSLI